MKYRIDLRGVRIGSSPKYINLIKSQFSQLKNIHTSSFDEVVLDIRKVQEVHLLPLVYIWHLAVEELVDNNNIQCIKKLSISDAIEPLFRKTRFLDRITGSTYNVMSKEFPNDFETFRVINGDPEENEIKKIVEETLGSAEFKSDFHKEFLTNYREVISNAFDHSSTDSEVIAVARRPEGTSKIEFCVFDRGRGVTGSFLSNPHLKTEYEDLEDTEVLEKCIEFGVSCNPNNKPHPDRGGLGNGGIGLFYLSQYCLRHPKSRFILLSGAGVLYIKNGKVNKVKLDAPIAGCAVYVETDINQSLSPDYQQLIDEYIHDSLS